MKISKLLPAICAFVLCASFDSIRAQDNPAQAAAREALLKQMNQVQAPEQQTPPPAAPVAPAAPAAPAAAPEVAPVAPATPAEPAAVAAPAAPAAPATPAPEVAPVAPAAPAAPAAPVEPTAVAAPAAPAPVVAPPAVSNPAPVPIVAPAIPISLTKEQRLQALLAKYKADQITPEQYHTQRAAIIAEP